MAGLSLALGAFIAGMLIAETEYKHQVETDIRPFHDVLLGLFFITHRHAARLACRVRSVAAGAAAGDRCRCCSSSPGRRCWRASSAPRPASRCAPASISRRPASSASCCWRWPTDASLLPPQLQSPVLASMVLSMLATPFIILYSNRIVMRLIASDWLLQSVAMTQHRQASDQHRGARDHLRLRPQRPEPGAPARGAKRIPYMALDLDPDRVRQAAAAGQSVVFGDAARLHSLMAAGPGACQRGRRHLHDTRVGAEDPAPRARACAEGAGGRAHASTTPTSSGCARPAPPRWCPRRSKAR